MLAFGATIEALRHEPGVAAVGAPQLSPAGDTVVLPTIPTTAPADAATSATLQRVRDLVPGNVAVSGLTAMTDDLSRQLSDTLPVARGLSGTGRVITSAALIMTVVFLGFVADPSPLV